MKTVTNELLNRFKETYESNPVNAASEAAIATVGIDDAAQNPECLRKHDFLFSDECKQGEPTNQKKSGRCWMFAALNSLRQNIMEKLEVENIELSETYLFFYDKIEKANAYLENVIKLKDEPEDSRLMYLIFENSTYDGGFWEYFTSLIKKYGVVPKDAMKETFHSGDSYMFTKQMNVRLQACAMKMRKRAAEGASDEELREMKEECLSDIYNICVKVLGRPVERFDFKYRDKNKKFRKVPNLTPQEFFEKYIGEKAIDKVTIVTDPRGKYPIGRVVESEYAINVIGGEPFNGLVVPMEEIHKAALSSVKAGIPCWFACDVGKDIHRKLGILDTDLFNYDQVLPALPEFEKKDRVICGYSQATHAMNITGVDLDDEGQPINWKVENSWGEENGKKGTFSMSDDWFKEYTFELIVDRKFVSEEYLKGLEEEHIMAEPWDRLSLMLTNMQ